MGKFRPVRVTSDLLPVSRYVTFPGPPAQLQKSGSLQVAIGEGRPGPVRTLSDGSGFTKGHAKRSSFGAKLSENLKEAFSRASSGSLNQNGGKKEDNGAGLTAQAQQGQSRNLSTQSMPPTTAGAQVSGTLSGDVSNSIPTGTIRRVESHPLSLGGESSDSQSEKNVKVFRTPSPRKYPMMQKPETFQATPRSQENTGIIGRMGDSDPALKGSLTLPTRPPSPTGSADDRSFVGSQSLGRTNAVPYAGRKRDEDFHALFPNVPEDDPLVEDYSCALQKDILVQGRLYVTEQRVCFYASIFSWVTLVGCWKAKGTS